MGWHVNEGPNLETEQSPAKPNRSDIQLVINAFIAYPWDMIIVGFMFENTESLVYCCYGWSTPVTKIKVIVAPS